MITFIDPGKTRKILKTLLGNIPYVKAFEGIREKKSIIFDDLDTPPTEGLNKEELNITPRGFFIKRHLEVYTHHLDFWQ